MSAKVYDLLIVATSLNSTLDFIPKCIKIKTK